MSEVSVTLIEAGKLSADASGQVPADVLQDTIFTAVISDRARLADGAENLIREACGNHADALLLYGDTEQPEDRSSGIPSERMFRKPGWSPDLFLSWDYIGEPVIYRTDLLQKTGGIRQAAGTAGLYDLTLRYLMTAAKEEHRSLFSGTEKERVIRISTVLSVAERNEMAPDAADAAKVLHDFFSASGIRAEAAPESDARLLEKSCRVLYDPVCADGTAARVSVIIPSKDNPDCLKKCVHSLVSVTDYPDYEIVVIDNGSSGEHKKEISDFLQTISCAAYFYEPAEFNFSAMCNAGAGHAAGRLLLFLNDDTVITDRNWMRVMAGQALQPWTGAVGAHLLYGDGSIQHCGILNLEDGPSHPLQYSPDDRDLYYGRNLLPYNYLAVTGACLMIGREKFTEAGGFPEELPVAYNDVSLGFRLNELGYFNVVRNDARLTHLESVSRGYDIMDEQKFRRLMRDKRVMYESHPGYEKAEPFSNPALSAVRTDFWPAAVYPKDYRPSFRFTENLPPVTAEMTVSLDFWHYGPEYVTASGWATSHDADTDRNAEKFLVIDNAGGQYILVPVFTERRPETAAQLGLGDDLVGWYTVADEAWIFQRNAHVGIMYRTEDRTYFNWASHYLERNLYIDHRLRRAETEDLAGASERNMIFNADRMDLSDREFLVVGNAFFGDDYYNSCYAYRLLLECGTEQYILGVDRIFRTDISLMFTSLPNLYWSGFRTSAELPAGKEAPWRISLITENLRDKKKYLYRIPTRDPENGDHA